MLRRLLSLSPLLLAAPAIAQDVPLLGGGLDGQEVAQLTIHERIVIRMAPPARMRRADRPVPQPVRWEEKHGPKCVPVGSLAGAAITQEGSVDLLTEDGERLRARFDDDCPSLAFYSGFYLKPTADGLLCADRDAIRARSGAVCPIDKFKRLKAKR